MFDIIREHQLNIMLSLSAICFSMAVLLLFTKFLPTRRKWILVGMEIIAMLLLSFDRMAYIYSGNESFKGFVAVRVSNFMVFFLTPAVVFIFNAFLIDLFVDEGRIKEIPGRLKFVALASIIGMFMAVISAFTGMYYFFDEHNVYHRGNGFLISYIIPIIGPLIQYSVFRQYRKYISKLIYIALVLYIFIPIACGIIQIFTYGISIVNMAMVMVSIFMYVFNYLDVNEEVVRAHEIEMKRARREQNAMKLLFDETATAFVKAVEKKDAFSSGYAVETAEIARKIAEKSGKTDAECDETYYSALLHNVGLIGIPDSIIEKTGKLTEEEEKKVREKPLISAEILSTITEYPYLSNTARYSYEKYDGSGYPEGLKGEEIPEVARIISVADAYENMVRKTRFGDPLPMALVRETFVKEAGGKYDPRFADIMVSLIDIKTDETGGEEEAVIQKELECKDYRDSITNGIFIDGQVKEITFECVSAGKEKAFSAPSIILFDSYDKRVHDNIKSVAEYMYTEYGEIWFDGHYVSTKARNMKIEELGDKSLRTSQKKDYKITASRYEDHLKLEISSFSKAMRVIIALPDRSKSAFIGITGENCHISDIDVNGTGKYVHKGDIPRIAAKESFIDRLESDIPNVQVYNTRSAYTQGIEIQGEFDLAFHTMSLPGASLVWHCPYIVIYYSDDGSIGGNDYQEFAMIKLNGEDNDDKEFAINKFSMKKKESFPGWEEWKKANKKGLECEISFARKGNKITMHTENLGIEIVNTTFINSGVEKAYVALTGDQVALTDIRID